MQMNSNYVESNECALIREALKSLDVSIQRNTDMLNEFWAHPPITDAESLTLPNACCIPDKDKSEKWYRNVLKQLRGGRNVDAVFRQLMIVCQSYGFSLPPPPTKDVTMRPTLNLQSEQLETHDLICQIYTRISKYYCEVLQTSTNQYTTIQALIALSYVLNPTQVLAQLHTVRLNQLNSKLPVITANYDLLIFYNRIKLLIQHSQDLLLEDMGVFLLGIFNQISEPNKVIRIVYLDRITKELIASFQQLKSTNQLGMYFCDIAEACYKLEQKVDHFLKCYAGMSILEVIHNPDQDDCDTPEVLWNWRLEVFGPYLDLFNEKVVCEKQELLAYISDTPVDFWKASTCKGDCICNCSKFTWAVGLGTHNVLCRMIKYCNVVKQLGDVAHFISHQVPEDADSGCSSESLTDIVNNMINEVVAAILLEAESLSETVPNTMLVHSIYLCYSSLHTLNSTSILPLTSAIQTVLHDKLQILLDQMIHTHNLNITNVVLNDHAAMSWSTSHTMEIKECSASIISLNLYLRVMYYEMQGTLPNTICTEVLTDVLEHSLTYLTERYLAAAPSKSNGKLFLYDITAIVMIYSTFIWFLTGEDVTQITEPSEGGLMVIYSNLNRLLGAMAVMTAPLPFIVSAISQIDTTSTAEGPRPESDGGSCTGNSPVVAHSHMPAEGTAPISYLPSVWLSNLYSIDNLNTSLLYILRCYNTRHPHNRDILMAAISNGAKIPQQTQLYHNRDTSKFEYNTVVTIISRLLSHCRYDVSAWSNFILTTFIPNEIWNCISKPNFKFSTSGQPEDLWQECIGEVFMSALEPVLMEVVGLVAYKTTIMPSTEEEVAVEELPCSCRINRYSTPSLKQVLHESLRAIFRSISILTSSLPPTIFKFSKVLCQKAKLKNDSQIAILKLLVGFFLKRLFTNPNEICLKYQATKTGQKDTNFLPFADIPEDTIAILRKVGDTARLIIMKDVLNVIPVSHGVQKFMEEEQYHVVHCLISLNDQLSLSLALTSALNSVQLDQDIAYLEDNFPTIFSTFLNMMLEITDVVSKGLSGVIKTVKLLPVQKFNPLQEFKSIGSFTMADVVAKVWNYDRLSEYYSTELLLRFLPSRWELTADANLSDETRKAVDSIREFIAREN